MNMMKKLSELYAESPVNIGIKSRNFAYVLFIMGITCVLLIPLILIMKLILVLPIILATMVFSFVCLVLLFKGKYKLATTIYFILLGFLPVLLALMQKQENYRDVYMYFFFCAPFFLLTAISGYLQFQIYMVGIIQLIMSIVFTIVRVYTIDGILVSKVSFSLALGIIFHIMITISLVINTKVEAKIIATLEADTKKTQGRLNLMRTLIKNTQSTMDAVQEASARLDKQTDEITNAVSTVEEINQSMDQITTAAKTRSHSVEKLVSEVDETKRVFTENIESLSKLKESSAEVFSVISVIENVASKTNLLAVNASIEASHAGEQGKGFAVVAEEIRKLAEKTNANSKRIREILQLNNKDLQNVDIHMTHSSELFEQIQTLTLEVREALNSILDGSTEVLNDSSHISDIIMNLEAMYKSVNSIMSQVGSGIADTKDAFTSLM